MSEELYYKILEYIPFVLMVFISLPFHEFAHGYIANKLGDDTAYYQGRLTLNPFAHLDLLGTLALVLFHFGWAKPVPVNPNRFKVNMRLGMALTAFAGPASNLLLALVMMILSKGMDLIFIQTGAEFLTFLSWIFAVMCTGNIGLAIFNLIPIPPLDGSKILNYFLPYKYANVVYKYERYGMIILLVLLWTPILSRPLGYAVSGIYYVLDKLTFFMG